MGHFLLFNQFQIVKRSQALYTDLIIAELVILIMEILLDLDQLRPNSVTIHSLSKIAESLPHLVMRKYD